MRPDHAPATHRRSTPGSDAPSAESLALLFELSLDLLSVTGAGGEFELVNPAFTAVLGYEPDELLGRPWTDLIHPDDLERTSSAVARVAEGLSLVDLENRYLRSDGTYIWLQWSARGTPDGSMYCVAREVTGRRRLERLLQETQAAAHIGGWELNYHTGDLYWTEETFRIHELSPVEFRPTPEGALRFYSPETLPLISAAVDAGSRTGKSWDLELQLITAKGNCIDVRAVGRTDLVDGEPARAYGSFQNITARKCAERELANAHALVEASIAQSPAGIIVADAPDGRYRIANTAALAILGVEHEAFIGRTPDQVERDWTVNHADGTPVKLEELPLRRAVQKGETTRDADMIIHRADGEERWVLASASPVRNAGGEIVAGIAIFPDITQRKRAEQSGLRRLRIIEATTDFVGTCDPNGKPIYLNRALRKLLGLGPDDPVPQENVFEYHPPASQEAIAAGVEQASREGLWAGEVLLLDREGNSMPVSQVIMAHRGESGEVEFLSTIMRDLTERKQLEEQLLHSQKLEGIGRLAGGVAHDFNNLLTVILGNAGLLDEMDGLDPRARACVSAVEQAAEQASQVTRQLLAFARKQIRDTQLVDLCARVEGLVPVLDRLLGEGVHLTTALAPEVWPVLLDPVHFEQVLVNLAVNASDSMPNGGDLEVCARNTCVTGGEHAELTAGEYVELVVRDTGDGIAPEIIKHIFEPFFTTKELGKGTGLGLATCHGIVRQSGGHIRVESRVGSGTAFHLYFPRASGQVAEAPEAAPELPDAEDLRGHETLLLVEDEDQVREVAVRALEQLGYRVLARGEGQAALELGRSYDQPIHAIVTDVVLPGLGGREVVAELRKLLGPLPVLYMSGYTQERIDEQGILREGARFLQKPFRVLELARVLREMLDA